jgi:hypothetical protein
MTRRELLATTPGLLLLNCSGNPPQKAIEKPPEPVTGLQALYQMHTFATTWAQDLKVIRLSSMNVPEVKAVPGKAAAWQAQFSSAALNQARAYTFSVYDESATVRQGIFADTAGQLSASTRSFVIGDATTDSDKALEISLAHGQKYSTEHPDMPVSFILEGDHQTGAPVWRVIWGLDAARSEFSVLVDAHAGTYLRTFS